MIRSKQQKLSTHDHDEEWTATTHSNTDESHGRDAEWGKPNTGEDLIKGFHLWLNFKKRQEQSMVTELRTVVTLGSRVISGGGGTREPSGILGNVQYLIWGSSSWEIYVKINKAVY